MAANATSTKVAVWCVPRSASTVLTRCLSGIDGLEVYQELFTYAVTFRKSFSHWTGRKLPMELEGNEALYDEANDAYEKSLGGRLYPSRVSPIQIKQDIENSNAKYIFIKEMAAPVQEDLHNYKPQGVKDTFLIRDPSRVYASYRKAAMANFTKVLSPDSEQYDIIRDDPLGIRPLLFFEKQYELWKYIKETTDPHPVIIDALDLVSRPENVVRAYCDAVGFPYNDDLLRWKPALEIPDNYVTAGDTVFRDIFPFYQTALESTHFMAPAPRETRPIPYDQLTDDVIRCVDHAMPFYHEMFAERLQA